MTRDDLLSEINLILLNNSFSFELLGCAKKSSGNIFFVGTLYFIYLKKMLIIMIIITVVC